MSGQFASRVVLVTGATGGIGAAVAERFAAEQARVVLLGHDPDKAQAAAGKVKAAGALDVLPLGLDVGDEAQVVAACDQVVQRFGRLDVVVNNAGRMTFKGLTDWSADDWLAVLRVDLIGAALLTREAFRRFAPPDGRGGGGGAIVNVASVHAAATTADVAPYAAAKAALLSLTRSAAIEGKPRGIRANAVLPGAVDTPMLWDNPNLQSGKEQLDPADVGQPADIAAAVLFLASDAARFITGATLAVDGGRLAQL